jgi:hypothetical protein
MGFLFSSYLVFFIFFFEAFRAGLKNTTIFPARSFFLSSDFPFFPTFYFTILSPLALSLFSYGKFLFFHISMVVSISIGCTNCYHVGLQLTHFALVAASACASRVHSWGIIFLLFLLLLYDDNGVL